MNDNQLKVLAARVIFFWLLLDLQSVLLRYVVVIVVHLGQVIFFVILNLKRLSMHLAKNNSLRLSISAASAVRVAAAHTLPLLRTPSPAAVATMRATHGESKSLREMGRGFLD